MAPRLLVTTRFGIGIKDPYWFEHRLALLSAITAPSLMAQADQEFEWVIITDSELPDTARDGLGEILSPFENRAHICHRGYGLTALRDLVETQRLVDPHSYLFAGRIDDDDAWDRDTVGEVRRRVDVWRSKQCDALGYGLSFETGLVWLMYDMDDMDQLRRHGRKVRRKAVMRRYSYPFTSISAYTYATVQDALAAATTGHSRVRDVMRENGYSIDVVVTEEPMWLYCRHKQTDSPIERGEGPGIPITLPDLEMKFGIDATRTRRYIENESQYGYGRVMRKFETRGKLIRELRALNETLLEGCTGTKEAAQLQERKSQLTSELAQLSQNVTNSPDEGPPAGGANG